jgi:hypothetical protein
MFEEVSTLNGIIMALGLIAMGFVSGCIVTLHFIFDGVSIHIGKKDKQQLNVVIGEEKEDL